MNDTEFKELIEWNNQHEKSSRCDACGKYGYFFRGQPKPRLYSGGVTIYRITNIDGTETEKSFSGLFCYTCKKKFEVFAKQQVAILVKQRMNHLIDVADVSEDIKMRYNYRACPRSHFCPKSQISARKGSKFIQMRGFYDF